VLPSVRLSVAAIETELVAARVAMMIAIIEVFIVYLQIGG